MTTAGATVNRFCSSGLQTVAMAAQACMVNGVPVAVGGGVEQISLVQPHMNRTHITEESLLERHPDLWMAMIDTADTVAGRYGVTRELPGRIFVAEPASLRRRPAVRRLRRRDRPLRDHHAGYRPREPARFPRRPSPSTATPATGRPPRWKGLAGLEPVRGEGKWITAGNASQLSDGASACLVMDSAEAGAAQCRAARHLQGLRHRRLRAR